MTKKHLSDEEHAAQYVQYMAQNPAYDFDRYCSQFRILAEGQRERVLNFVQQKLEQFAGERKPSDEILKLLNNPRLFDIITDDELGKKIVGELETRKAIFTCGCGVLVKNNNIASYNCLVNAEAGAGKDYTLKETLAVFPSENYIYRNRISEKVLNYWHNSLSEPEWTWNGKLLYLEDASQAVLNSEVVKIFFSSGSKTTLLINQVPTDLEVNGKPVAFISSASAKLEDEQMRRMPILNCDETAKQTAAIMLAQGKRAATVAGAEITPMITQALRHLKRVDVLVPFAEALALSIPPSHIILRTHFPRFLDYIRAVAALYQYQRKSEDGFIVAQRQDYELGSIAFRATTSNQFYVPLSHQQKKLIGILRDLKAMQAKPETEPQKKIADDNKEQVFFTLAEVSELCNFWGDDQLRKELDKLAKHGIMATSKRKLEGSRGQPAKAWALQEISISTLPTWEQLMVKMEELGISQSNPGNKSNESKQNNQSNQSNQNNAQKPNNLITSNSFYFDTGRKLLFLQDVPAWKGVDRLNYGPFKAGADAELPQAEAQVLIKAGIAQHCGKAQLVNNSTPTATPVPLNVKPEAGGGSAL